MTKIEHNHLGIIVWTIIAVLMSSLALYGALRIDSRLDDLEKPLQSDIGSTPWGELQDERLSLIAENFTYEEEWILEDDYSLFCLCDYDDCSNCDVRHDKKKAVLKKRMVPKKCEYYVNDLNAKCSKEDGCCSVTETWK